MWIQTITDNYLVETSINIKLSIGTHSRCLNINELIQNITAGELSQHFNQGQTVMSNGSWSQSFVVLAPDNSVILNLHDFYIRSDGDHQLNDGMTMFHLKSSAWM